MKNIGMFLFFLLLLIPAARAQNTGTIPLPGSIPASVQDGTVTALEPYPEGHLLSLKIHLAKIGDDKEDQERVFNTVSQWLKDNGFGVQERDPADKQLRLILAGGTVKIAEDAFQVEIEQYEIDEFKYYANDRPPSIPIPLNGIITVIEGLDNFPPPATP